MAKGSSLHYGPEWAWPKAGKRLVYIGGSMRERGRILHVKRVLEQAGYDTFTDWLAPGEQTDDKWQEWERMQGHSYLQALQSEHARDVFNFDKTWLDRSDAIVLVYPAGRSAHVELGYLIGRGKPGFIYLAGEPERFDVMALFATAVVDNEHKLLGWLEETLG